jgi:methionine biosynthesis protein MetW
MKRLLSATDRLDYSVIGKWIAKDSWVLDMGCGSGSLLEYLIREKNIRGMGIDVNQQKIVSCIARGIPVIQQDLNEDMDNFKDNSYDYAILSQTLQVMHHPDRLILDTVRIAKYGIVSFPNFAHASVRLKFGATGKMPKSKSLPFEWYDTPNIHNFTVKDFRRFCRENGIEILEEFHIHGKTVTRSKLFSNLFSEGTVALITKKRRKRSH